jgi:hypothetical protein
MRERDTSFHHDVSLRVTNKEQKVNEYVLKYIQLFDETKGGAVELNTP